MTVRVQPSADVDERAVLGDGTSVWHLAQIREDAVVGPDCTVGRGAYIGSGVRMGARCKVQNYALVYEPAVLEDGVFVGPAVVFTNDHFPRAVAPDGSLKSAHDWEPVGVTVRTGASIGARAVCVAPVTVGRWAMVAAGCGRRSRRPRLRARRRRPGAVRALGRSRGGTARAGRRRPGSLALPADRRAVRRVRRCADAAVTGRPPHAPLSAARPGPRPGPRTTGRYPPGARRPRGSCRRCR